MTANALVPCFIIVTTLDKWFPVFQEAGFQLSVPSQCKYIYYIFLKFINVKGEVMQISVQSEFQGRKFLVKEKPLLFKCKHRLPD